jgi:hypothetical protein
MLNKSCCSRHFEFHIRTKNAKFLEDHPMNIHVQFGFNGPLQTVRFLFRYEIQNGGYSRTCLTLDPMGNMFQNASSPKPLGQLKPNCPGMEGI